jgi:E3 ubiquitin-protein ligase HECTD4
MLLNCCNQVIHKNTEDLENRLQGLEKVSKATILGHMLPSLMTAMTHKNLQCLNLADTLMPQLVKLVVLSSQVIFPGFIFYPSNTRYPKWTLPCFNLDKAIHHF